MPVYHDICYTSMLYNGTAINLGVNKQCKLFIYNFTILVSSITVNGPSESVRDL